jgi:hypothetical protein
MICGYGEYAVMRTLKIMVEGPLGEVCRRGIEIGE